jgi:hypothetical protein
MLLTAFAFFTFAVPAEPPPIDAMIEAAEARDPSLREMLSATQAELGRLGAVEAGWSTSGSSWREAAGGGPGEGGPVLGEWEVGGHAVTISGDRPLSVPAGMHRYTVRAHDGPADYHGYHRAFPGIVIHAFGAATRIGNAECQRSQGIELIADRPWQDWPSDTQFVVFAVTRAMRDDRRDYCILYRRAGGGRFLQLAFARDGRPYLIANTDPAAFVITPRARAAARMFSGSGGQAAARALPRRRRMR